MRALRSGFLDLDSFFENVAIRLINYLSVSLKSIIPRAYPWCLVLVHVNSYIVGFILIYTNTLLVS